ncbi:MAG TPA: dTMP kinase [Rectinemataceae bacterium]|nr:dTMP kinase [Rectinemataceae bacterium]
MSIAENPVLPKFIVLEGTDGTGTTTQLKTIHEALARAGIPHWTTCEPTDGPIGRLIRRILGGELRAAPGTVAHLFAADRHEHLYGAEGIAERLGRGEVVVCDRYILSSLAYQGSACGLQLPLSLNAAFPLPGLLLYFDVDPHLSMSRIEGRERRDIYETLSFQELVRSTYEEAMRLYEPSGMEIRRIDASLTRAEVSGAVLADLERRLGLEPGLLRGNDR